MCMTHIIHCTLCRIWKEFLIEMNSNTLIRVFKSRSKSWTGTIDL
jgi:hypothetical protein